MLAAVRSATVFGVEGRPVTVEVHVSTGLPSFQIVGLPDEACRESELESVFHGWCSSHMSVVESVDL